MSQQRGFFFHHSNDLERLADALGEQVRACQRAALLKPIAVTVPHSGVGIWLTQWLAKRHGICANIEFLLPTERVWQLAKEVHEPDAVREARGLDAEALTLGLHAALCEADGDEDQWLTDYLARASRGAPSPDRPRLALARRLAGLFRDYAIYRPDWIDAWSRGRQLPELDDHPDARWQSRLWRQVWMRVGAEGSALNPGSMLAGLAERLARAEPAGSDAIFLFGISQLPPVFLDIFNAASASRPVHLYAPNPCDAYWGDVQGERRRLKEQISKAGKRASSELVDDVIPNDLLGSLGRQGQVFLSQVFERVDDQLPHDQEVGYRNDFPVNRRLGWLQQALLDLGEPGHREVDVDDDSVQIHDAHSRLREVQILHDRVLGWLDRDGPHGASHYRPRDILVIAPDIDAYAPYVRAVFGSEDQALPRLPFNISDRKAIDGHPLVQAFLELLELPVSDMKSERVVSTLETPAIARRFGLDAAQLEDIRRWVAETCVHWGLDAAHREALGTGPGSAANTWRHAVDRLLVGYAVNDESQLLDLGDQRVLPSMNVEGSGGEAVGRLSLWISQLGDLRQILPHARSPKLWQRFLNQQVIDVFFHVDPADLDELAALECIRDAIDGMLRAAERAACEATELSWDVVREWLRSALTNTLGSRRFLSRGITFANMVPLRSVPARIVCLLGMNGGEFPRTSTPPTFDLMNRLPRRGDRSQREEERYLFLETLLATRDILYISHVGRDPQENEPIEPSPLVREVQDFLERAHMPVDAVQHPLQPFSRRCFNADDPARQSHHREWLPAAQSLRAGGAREAERFSEPPERLPDFPPGETWPDAITVHELARFIANPVERYFRDVLHLYLGEAGQQLSSDFEEDGLSNYALAGFAADAALANGGAIPDDCPDEIERARAWLPQGLLGRLKVEKAFPVDLVSRLQETLKTAGEPSELAVDASVQLRDATGRERSITVTGNIDNYYPTCNSVIEWAPGEFHGKRRALAIARWVALNASHQGEPIDWLFFGKDGKPNSFSGAAIAYQEWLADLVALYLRGRTAPIPFFPETAWERIKVKGNPWQRFAVTGPYRTGERDRNPYIGQLARHWTEADLYNPAFEQATQMIFRDPQTYG